MATLDQLEVRVTTLESRNKRHDQDIAALVTTCSDTLEQVHALRADATQIKSTLAEHTSAFGEINGRITEVTGKLSVFDERWIEVSGATRRQGAEFQGRFTALEQRLDDQGAAITGLKADMTEVKGTLTEILRRLPPPDQG